MKYDRISARSLVVFLGLAVSMVAAACGGENGDGQRDAESRDTVRERLNQTDRRLRGAFRVMRADRRAVDELPSGLASEARTLGMDPLAARLAYDLGTSHLYAMTGGDRFCVMDSRRVLTNCWPKGDVLRGAAGMAALCAPNLAPGTIQLAGIVPDGVSRVTVIRPDRRDVTVPVDRNAWLAVLPGKDPLPLTVRWRGSGRVERHLSGIPDGTTYERCGAHKAPPSS
jgi:hypothetical protein